ncbi:hypothetical protein [Streptomyces sp. AA1529]|uniref:hypothetical protein n=1 Tax=Streptomyces sp. AA1529 TaxID=1203257 RepID=UPI0002F3EC62|nr:hypothetical protein [Streptomyces sp. AA1529]
MTYRPYPSRGRALHQIGRHARPQTVAAQQPLITAQAAEQLAARLRAALPTAQQFVESWNAQVRESIARRGSVRP